MPKKRPGLHNIHVKITEDNYRILQEYCWSGAERLTATALIDLLLETYVEDYVKPRMSSKETANWTAANNDIPRVAAKVAYRVEPTAFPDPTAKN